MKVGTVRERTEKVWDVARAVASRDWNRTWDPDTREGGGVGLNVERNFPGEFLYRMCFHMPSLRLEVSGLTDLLRVGPPWLWSFTSLSVKAVRR